VSSVSAMTSAAGHGVRFLPSVAGLVLQGIGQHRLLTTRQAQVLYLPDVSLRYTQRVLAELRNAGLIDKAHAAHGTALWFATPQGRLLLRSQSRLESQADHDTPWQNGGLLRARTLALNDAGIAFVKAARERDGDECDAFSWHHEIAHSVASTRRHGRERQQLIADALLSYGEPRRDQGMVLHQRFIELDLPTSPAWELAVKLAKYKLLHHCQALAARPDGSTESIWRSRYRTFPQILVILAGQDPVTARRRIEHLVALWHSDSATRDLEQVPLHLVTLEQLISDGPYAPIFTNADQPEQPENWLGHKLDGRSEQEGVYDDRCRT
jgi:hypothetical protein